MKRVSMKLLNENPFLWNRCLDRAAEGLEMFTWEVSCNEISPKVASDGKPKVKPIHKSRSGQIGLASWSTCLVSGYWFAPLGFFT